ncbi:MAG: cytochrome-c oxidase, cbb3-type subunit II, partial [Bdellovibrionaceae bacterium]|nr:cytochrome-c oxidase, cbb3-type subunit II [Pseudobdellovibrionaceae bacterium]
RQMCIRDSIYYISMWAAGITQGLMWRAVDGSGQLLYPDFVETTMRIMPLYWVRAVGGALFIVGFVVGVYNIWMTIKSAPAEQKDSEAIVPARRITHGEEGRGHRRLEGLATVFTVLAILSVVVGSVIEIYPTLALDKYIRPEKAVAPWTPLELAGREIYVREGCYVCHTQMIRKTPDDVLRYGPTSTIEESMYDHPHQWGSRRTGPDLARVGKKYPNLWHYQHMLDPRATSQNSVMPSYPWLAEKDTDFISLRKKMSVLKRLGTPYTEDQLARADIIAEEEAKLIAKDLEDNGAPRGLEKKEIVALIAYLQALGQKEIKK